MTAASVLVPTHSAASTLDLAVESALQQTVDDIEVVVIGDGVTPEVREVIGDLLQRDARVRFLDKPKGEHHGETYRDEAIRSARSPIVSYLCDDDLLLPNHVESMVELLSDADIAQSLNGYIDASGEFVPYPSDLASPAFREWLLRPDRNSVSVTGTAHTVASYLRIPHGWEAPPPGRWTDHFMWQKFLVLPGLRAATSDRVTALQFPTHLAPRKDWSPVERRAELARWLVDLDDPAALASLDDSVRGALNRTGAALRVTQDVQQDAAVQKLRDQQADLDDLREKCAGLVRSLAMAESAHEELTARLALIEGSRTWRLRESLLIGPLRRLTRR